MERIPQYPAITIVEEELEESALTESDHLGLPKLFGDTLLESGATAVK